MGNGEGALARSSAEVIFRLVIVLDWVLGELVQVIGYLGPVPDEIDIGLVTVSAQKIQAPVPPRITEAQVTALHVGTLYRGSDEFRTVIAGAHPARRRSKGDT